MAQDGLCFAQFGGGHIVSIRDFASGQNRHPPQQEGGRMNAV
ncbi:MAG: hypothetical protein ACI8QF_004554 [Limisphaerales bacterium]|jgi:hypothetical protein